jgi:hypothetical protein
MKHVLCIELIKLENTLYIIPNTLYFFKTGA